MTELTPRKLLDAAEMMETKGTIALRVMLSKHSEQFWGIFGCAVRPGRLWADLSDDELEDINRQFVATLRRRARLLSN